MVVDVKKEKTGWGEVSEDGKNKKEVIKFSDETECKSKPQQFSNEDVEEMLNPDNQLVYSPINLAAVGWDGTGKSGSLMDNYKKVIMPDGSICDNVLKSCEYVDGNDHILKFPDGMRIVHYDADGSAGPLKTKFHKSHRNIIIVDPIVLSIDGSIDFIGCYNKVLAVTKYLVENQAKMNLFAVNLDGYDKVLKWCEITMKYLDLKIDPQAQIKDQWQWSKRNNRMNNITLLLKRLACETYYTTHHKKEEKYEYDVNEKKKMLTETGHHPDWVKTFPGSLFQNIEFTRDYKDGIVTFTATVNKAKGNLRLEGAVITVATVSNAEVTRDADGKVQVTGDYEWFGINDILNEFRRPAK